MTAPPGPHGRAERRSALRTEILGEMPGDVMIFQPMSVREISEHGALIETAYPLQVDSLHQLRLVLNDASVVVQGRVAHCSISDMDRDLVSYRSGMEFVGTSTEVRDAIARFAEAVRIERVRR